MKIWNNSNDDLLVAETLLSTANGYIGMRGNFEEGYAKEYKSVRDISMDFLTLWILEYGESAFGFPKTAQKVLNVIDCQTIRIIIDGDEFSMFSGQVISVHRELDLIRGIAVRNIEWVSPKGHHLDIEIKRMASFSIGNDDD